MCSAMDMLRKRVRCIVAVLVAMQQGQVRSTPRPARRPAPPGPESVGLPPPRRARSRISRGALSRRAPLRRFPRTTPFCGR